MSDRSDLMGRLLTAENEIAYVRKQLDEARAQRDAMRKALVAMCVQYLTDSPKGRDDELREFYHAFMSAGEDACDVLCDQGLATETPTGATLTKDALEGWWKS